MIRRACFSFLVVACLIAGTQRAEAQGGYRGSADNPVGPTVSPYLNLLNTDQFGVTNYQSLVRPLVQQGNAINRQGNELNRIQQQISSPRGGYGGAATGHTTFFMNYSHFYPGASGR